MISRDKTSEELLAEIERLRAKVGKMEFLMRSTEDTCLACAIKLEVIDQQAARIKELEEALAEYQRLGKTIAGKVPCLTLHGDCGRCSAKMREVCGALEQIAGGKIGPDADECPDDLPPIGSPYRSWQITDERILAIENAISSCVLIERYTGQDLRQETAVLRGMLREAGQ